MHLVCTLTFVHLGNSDKITKTDDGAVSNWQQKKINVEKRFCSLIFRWYFWYRPQVINIYLTIYFLSENFSINNNNIKTVLIYCYFKKKLDSSFQRDNDFACIKLFWHTRLVFMLFMILDSIFQIRFSMIWGIHILSSIKPPF